MTDMNNVAKVLHPRLEVKRVIQIHVEFSAEDWDLYSDESHLYASVIAGGLNRQLEEYVNRGEARSEVTRLMHSLMHAMREEGAYDTEPRAFLERILDQIYGDKV